MKKKDKKPSQSVLDKEKESTNFKWTGKYFEAVGRRKKAIARVRIYNNKKKKIIINNRDYKKFLPTFELIKTVEDPLKATGHQDVSISVLVKGGGIRSQAEAIRHGISRALLKLNSELRPTLKPLGFLTRDPRKKERKKPGLKRARRAPQWKKR